MFTLIRRMAPFSAVLAGIWLFACGGSKPPTAPTDPPTPQPAFNVSRFITGVRAFDGTQATQQSASAPAASGGPAATPIGNGSVVSGGSSQVRVQSAAAFQTVYVFIGGTSSTVGGHWALRLSSATTDVTLFVTYATDMPATAFQSVFAVASAGGAIGAYTSLPTQVLAASTGDVQVSVSWDALADVDLHVVDPSREEIYYGSPTAASGGRLDLDSNAACAIDRKNNENIRWTPRAPGGSYTVRVDYWASCGVPLTNYLVTVKNGGTTTLFNGSFTGLGDAGGEGSGRLITTFTHAASLSDLNLLGVAPPVLFTPSPLKIATSGTRR